MNRKAWVGLAIVMGTSMASSAWGQDAVLQWNSTIRAVIQQDGTHPVHKANPGWSTRSIAMMNTSIYDIFQAFDRTHKPWLVNATAPAGASRDAAVHQAAFELLLNCYPDEQPMLQADYDARMALIPNGQAKTDGMNFGSLVAAQCVVDRTNDGALLGNNYVPLTGPGKWCPDPFNPGQVAWGPVWRGVKEFGIDDATTFVAALPPLPALNSQAYTDAYNQVKSYGDVNSAVRTTDQENIGLFWAYDRPSMGPPPVLFVRNLEEIAAQAGNTPEENARMFAMASVTQADAAIAAWDAKFEYNLWRPVGGIHEAGVGGAGDADGNPDTVGDAMWRPLGAPGGDPNNFTDDFTPPFPAWTSGHATMGGAVFKAIELFYGTNSFDAINGVLGDDAEYELTSQEFDAAGAAGMTRLYDSFTQQALLAPGMEDSPEGENGMSRIYLGIHWIFDQVDGIALGNSIAAYVDGNFFQAVPEPSGLALGALAVAGLGSLRRSRRRG